MLEVRDLVKSHGKGVFKRVETRILNGVSLEVQPGEVLGIIGNSGAGKSTLAHLMMGEGQPDSGQVLMNGHDIFDLKGKAKAQYKRRVQLISQNCDTALNPYFTVAESIREIFLVHGRQAFQRTTREDIKTILEQVGLLETHMARYPSELSGGQLQRVIIARAMALAPEVIIADEPTSSLDLSTQAQVMNLILSVTAKINAALVLISHDMALVAAICHRVVVLENGIITRSGPVREVISQDRETSDHSLFSSISPSMAR
jgi:ABC-type glutathione transport system ATPase component